MYHAAAGEGGGDDDGGAREGGDQAAAGTAAAGVEAEERAREEEGSLFWMSFDDFTSEFSQARKRSSRPPWYKRNGRQVSFTVRREMCV